MCFWHLQISRGVVLLDNGDACCFVDAAWTHRIEFQKAIKPQNAKNIKGSAHPRAHNTSAGNGKQNKQSSNNKSGDVSMDVCLDHNMYCCWSEHFSCWALIYPTCS